MAAVLREIIVDCHDPATVAAFWSAALGWTVGEHPGGVLWMSASGASDGGLLLVLVPSRAQKSGRNRLRLAVGPAQGDLAAEVERLTSLGARPVGPSQEGATWVVLADPEGNEFCVVGPPSGAAPS